MFNICTGRIQIDNLVQQNPVRPDHEPVGQENVSNYAETIVSDDNKSILTSKKSSK